ncbi:MAG: ABC transporter permease [Deltaproteobacteria bacterium]|nr:ABC transporter permease [Deltaproteobacteria bacterium]
MMSLAWRNLWRNPRRTWLTVVALALGVTAIVFLHSYRESSYGELIRSITRGHIGHLQVHGFGYQKSPAIEVLVTDPASIEAKITSTIPGASTERRVLGAGLAGSKELSAPVMVVGIQPASAPELYSVQRGVDLGAKAERLILVGVDLAAELEIGPKDELVLLAQAADGSVANDRFVVGGLVDSSSAEMNAAAVFLHVADAQSFFGLESGVHQLIVRVPGDGEDLTTPLSALRGALDLRTLEAMSWAEILPELKSTMVTKRKNQHLIDIIVLMIVALGVLNAMSMSTFERIREFGVMSSLGTRPSQILRLVLIEALIQGALGFLIGMGVSFGLLYGIGSIDLSNVMQGDMMGARMPSRIILTPHVIAIQSAAMTAFGTVLLGGLIPALRAARLRPAEALRHV